MIDAHLASLSWHAAVALMFAGALFGAGMAFSEKQGAERREWEARRRAKEMRR